MTTADADRLRHHHLPLRSHRRHHRLIGSYHRNARVSRRKTFDNYFMNSQQKMSTIPPEVYQRRTKKQHHPSPDGMMYLPHRCQVSNRTRATLNRKIQSNLNYPHLWSTVIIRVDPVISPSPWIWRLRKTRRAAEQKPNRPLLRLLPQP